MEVVMLEHYYRKPQTLDRLSGCWIGAAIERYVQWLAENKYSERSVFHRVPVLVHFGEFARAQGAQCIEELPAHVGPFATLWLQEHGRNCRNESARRSVYDQARNVVEQMLKVALPNYAAASARRARPDPFGEQAPGFFGYLRDERGLKESSIAHYCNNLRQLESYLRDHDIVAFAAISPVVVSAFITTCVSRLAPVSRSNFCAKLKVFFRYLLREGIVATDLSASVGTAQIYRFTEIPRAISWEEVRRMFEMVDRRSAVGKRDYAILLLLVTYGLRAHEVAGMTLDDIDWKHERLRVPERKAGHSTAYPLSPLVGNAIIDYLQRGRPETSERGLFFRQTAPYHPLKSYSVASRATVYLRKAGIEAIRAGAHTLRHTCVTRLVDAEFDLKTIGDYVGHGRSSSTQIYTKIEVEALREVALGDGEAIL
jgi:integrase/recombinase XerD